MAVNNKPNGTISSTIGSFRGSVETNQATKANQTAITLIGRLNLLR
ncbi:MAG: hypothetical protein WCJ24_02190 [Candidatus Saccharibacteria bacterium]